MIRNKDFYKIRSRNYHHQLFVSKEKLINSKNKCKEIRQVNKELQQKINELKTVNKIISFQRQRCLLRSISSAESERHDTSDMNVSISTRKSTKHFNFESFISCRKGLKWKKWCQKIEIKMIVNADHWNNEATKIDYVCSHISEEIVDHVYVQSDIFRTISTRPDKMWSKI